MNLNFMWLGGTFPYPYQLAVESASRTQKVDGISLWHLETPAGEYFDAIKDKVELHPLEKMNFPAVQGTQGEWERMAALKDYYAYRLLYFVGGIVMDLDTLSVKDVTGLLGDQDLIVADDCPPEQWPIPYPYNASIMIGRQGSPRTKELMDVAAVLFQWSPSVKWGAAGPVLISKMAQKYPDKIHAAPFGVLGGFGGGQAVRLYLDGGELPENCHIVHCFAYAWKRRWRLITPEYVRTSNTLYTRTARRVCGIDG